MEDALWHQLKIAVPHIVHEVDVRDVQDNSQDRTTPHKNWCHHGDREKQEINHMFSKWMDDSCQL